jgi:hypothetical protein
MAAQEFIEAASLPVGRYAAVVEDGVLVARPYGPPAPLSARSSRPPVAEKAPTPLPPRSARPPTGKKIYKLKKGEEVVVPPQQEEQRSADTRVRSLMDVYGYSYAQATSLASSYPQLSADRIAAVDRR